MIIAVTGGRHFGDVSHVYKTLDYFRETYGPFKLHVGDATGLDYLALQWATDHRNVYRRFVAEWKLFGKSAGPIRNREMLEDADMLIAFDGGRGTNDAIKAATDRNIPVRRV